MPIAIACPTCGHTENVLDRFAGQSISCSACRSPLVVPGISASPSHQSAALDVLPVKSANTFPVLLLVALCSAGVGCAVVLLFVLVLPWLTLALSVLVSLAAIFALLNKRADPALRWLVPSGPARYVTPRVCCLVTVAAGLILLLFSTLSIGLHRKSAAADREVARLVEEARRQVTLGNLSDAKVLLEKAVATTPWMGSDSGAASLLAEVRQTQEQRQTVLNQEEAGRILGAVEGAIARKEFKEGIRLLKEYLAHPHATGKANAGRLLVEVERAISPEAASAALEAMTDDQFAAWTKNGTLPAELRCSHVVLAKSWAELLASQGALVAKQRETRRTAEEKAAAQAKAEEREREEQDRQRRAELRKSKPDDDARQASAEETYRSSKAEFEAARQLQGVQQLVENAQTAKEEFFKNRLLSRATDLARDIVKTCPGTVAAADAQKFIDTKKLPSRTAPANPDEIKLLPADRLPDLEQSLDLAAIGDWGTELKQIPATVVDKGVLKYVPYQSFRAGDYEFNIYGDPAFPACLEIGVYGDSLKSRVARERCVAFMASLLPDAGDRCLLRSLKLTEDLQKRAGLTFEVTPSTAEDAYGGWWISVYDTTALDKSRASPKEIEAITVQKKVIEKPTSSSTSAIVPSWTPREIAAARPGGGSVYVRAYTRKDGTYVRAHTRSARGSRR